MVKRRITFSIRNTSGSNIRPCMNTLPGISDTGKANDFCSHVKDSHLQ